MASVGSREPITVPEACPAHAVSAAGADTETPRWTSKNYRGAAGTRPAEGRETIRPRSSRPTPATARGEHRSGWAYCPAIPAGSFSRIPDISILLSGRARLTFRPHAVAFEWESP